MGLLVVNSDFEKLWGEPMPSISFDNTSYSLAGEVGTELSAAFSITDNYDADVTEQCEITFSNDYVHIEEGQFVCDDLEVGTYATEVTATYSYKSATVTATATINISVEEEQPTSISFDSASYSVSGNEHAALSAQFSVEDNLGNDITSLCAYSFSPNDKGVYADGGYFKVDSAVAGTYNITVTATYGQLTATATIAMAVVDYPDSISFDSASYSMSGNEGDTITQAFTVTDDLSNDVTASCSYAFSPNDTGITASNGAFDASSVLAGTYSVTVTATYASGNGSTLTATATISIEVTASHDYSQDYLTFEALENGTFTLTVPANIDSSKMTSVSYSTDGGTTWTDTTIDSTAQTITTPTINDGDKVLWKGVGNSLSGSSFSSTGNFNASGNAMSLFYGDNFANQTALSSEAALSRLFMNNRKIVSAENMILPATTLKSYCYQQMFLNCSSLTTAPALPATNLGGTSVVNVYANMFQNCTSLTTVPTLPATRLVNNCYQNMFSGCTSLTTIPSGFLPATTLAEYCYYSMFKNCTSLTTVPSDLLPATTLASYCYGGHSGGMQTIFEGMFTGCTSLTTAPELPATTLAQSCYEGMFYGCTNLSSITMLATDISANSCLFQWVNGVAATGTFTKAAAQTSLSSGINGIPSGWTVVDAS